MSKTCILFDEYDDYSGRDSASKIGEEQYNYIVKKSLNKVFIHHHGWLDYWWWKLCDKDIANEFSKNNRQDVEQDVQSIIKLLQFVFMGFPKHLQQKIDG